MSMLNEFRGKLGLGGTVEVNPVWQIVGLGLTMAGAYHGYKRNCGSIGWGIGWGILMPMTLGFAAPFAYAQGFGKPKRKCLVAYEGE